jgi:hypothetical protein
MIIVGFGKSLRIRNLNRQWTVRHADAIANQNEKTGENLDPLHGQII